MQPDSLAPNGGELVHYVKLLFDMKMNFVF